MVVVEGLFLEPTSSERMSLIEKDLDLFAGLVELRRDGVVVGGLLTKDSPGLVATPCKLCSFKSASCKELGTLYTIDAILGLQKIALHVIMHCWQIEKCIY